MARPRIADPDGRRRRTREWVLAVVLFATTALVFTAPGLRPGQGMGGFDLVANTTPFREGTATPIPRNNPLQSDQLEQLPLVAEFWESARAGDLQLWEPDHAAGMPLTTAVYTRVLAPPNLVYAVLPGWKAGGAAIALALFLSQLGAYALARRMGLGLAGGLLAGVAYGFSGPVVAMQLRIHETAMLPWVLLGVDLCFDRRRRGAAVVLTAGATLGTLLSGFPAAAMHVLYAAGAFALWSVVDAWRHDGRSAALGGGAACAAGGLGGALLAAPVLLPSAEWLANAGGLDRSFDITHALGLDRLATAVAGRFFGAPQDGDFRLEGEGLANGFEASMTMGVVVLLLLGWLVWSPPSRDRTRRPLRGFLAPTGTFVLVAVVLGGPALGLVHQLPFMEWNSFGRARFIVSLVVALTAGVGLDRLVADRRPTTAATDTVLRWWAVTVLAMVGVGTYLAGSQAAVDGALGAVARDLAVPVACGTALVLAAFLVRSPQRTAQRGRPVVVPAVAVVALAVELQAGAWGFQSTPPRELFYPVPDLPAAMAEDVGPTGEYRFSGTTLNVLTPHQPGLNDLTDLRVSFPSYGPWRDLMEAMDPGTFSRLRTIFSDEADWTSPVLDRLATRYLASPLGQPLLLGRPASVTSSMSPELEWELPATDDPIRGIVLDLDTDGCREGWVEIQADGQLLSRRLARQAGSATSFPTVDLDDPGTAVRVTATDCELRATTPTVGYVLGSGPLRVIGNDGITIYERPDARPRIDVAEAVATTAEDRVLTAVAELPATTAVVSTPVEVDPGATATTSVDLSDPDELRATVVADGRVLVVLRDVLAPGWQATVDGEPAELVVVDHALRGVVVPAGEHEVRLRYWPTTMTIGLWLAGLGGLLLGAALAPIRRSRPA